MRYSSIDILRTLAIVVMVFVHFAENLSGVILPITGLGAPLFVFLSGLSYSLWVRGLEIRRVSDEQISKMSVRRALFVFGAGFAFNILVWLPEDTFNWDVLTFIGAALLLLNGIRRLPFQISVFAAVVSVLISPVLRHLADYEAYWMNGHFEVDLTLPDVVAGFLATAYFPVFPWVACSITGFVTGSLLTSGDSDRKSALPRRIMSCGAVFTVGAGILLAIRPILPVVVGERWLGGWQMFPATIEYVSGTTGLVLVLFGLTHWLVDHGLNAPGNQSWMDIARTFSRHSLTIYVAHHLVHLWPLWIVGVTMGEEPTFYWQRAMPLSYSLSLGVLFLVLSFFALQKIGPDRRLGLEGWMRWLCD
jgi:uncharacterized membrane protein